MCSSALLLVSACEAMQPTGNARRSSTDCMRRSRAVPHVPHRRRSLIRWLQALARLENHCNRPDHSWHASCSLRPTATTPGLCQMGLDARLMPDKSFNTSERICRTRRSLQARLAATQDMPQEPVQRSRMRRGRPLQRSARLRRAGRALSCVHIRSDTVTMPRTRPRRLLGRLPGRARVRRHLAIRRGPRPRRPLQHSASRACSSGLAAARRSARRRRLQERVSARVRVRGRGARGRLRSLRARAPS